MLRVIDRDIAAGQPIHDMQQINLQFFKAIEGLWMGLFLVFFEECSVSVQDVYLYMCSNTDLVKNS